AAPGRFRRGLALVGALYGALHFALQGKGWEYHLNPLAAFLCVLGAATLAAHSRESRGISGTGLLRPAALCALAVTVVLLGAKGVEALEPEWIAAKRARVDRVVRDLGPVLRPGGTVQVMDTTEGGIHALLRLGLREPTRFLYDFHFFHDAGDSRIQA